MNTSRWIDDLASLQTFQAEYARRAGTRVELSYLQRSRVRARFDAAGDMVGGYVLCGSAPFRYIEALPLSAEQLLGPGRVDDFHECTCIWMDRGLSQPLRLLLYLRLLADHCLSDKRFMLGGSLREKVARVQRQGLPHLVYEGPAGVDGHSFQAWVYYGSVVDMIRGLLRRAPGRLWRGMKQRNGGAERQTRAA